LRSPLQFLPSAELLVFALSALRDYGKAVCFVMQGFWYVCFVMEVGRAGIPLGHGIVGKHAGHEEEGCVKDCQGQEGSRAVRRSDKPKDRNERQASGGSKQMQQLKNDSAKRVRTIEAEAINPPLSHQDHLNALAFAFIGFFIAPSQVHRKSYLNQCPRTLPSS